MKTIMLRISSHSSPVEFPSMTFDMKGTVLTGRDPLMSVSSE